MKKICFITTSRADFGNINELLKITIKRKLFFVQLIVSGSHTSKVFGNTTKEIINNKDNIIIVSVISRAPAS